MTVAEDLLENDGKKFLEMMDRLADRKVQRDDDLMDNRGVYEEYDDEDDGEFEDDGPEEVYARGIIASVMQEIHAGLNAYLCQGLIYRY